MLRRDRSTRLAHRVATLVAASVAAATLVVAPARAADDLGAGPLATDAQVADAVGTRPASVGPTTTVRTATRETETYRRTKLVVNWKGTWDDPKYTKTTIVPGIGNVSLICRPNSTMIKLYVSKRDAETQMWSAVYQTKNNHAVVAVKNARVYRYANADDDGTGGTGHYTNEGWNQSSPPEDFSQGYQHGIISQRPGRNQPAGGVAQSPVTSFELNWYWAGFRSPRDYQLCRVEAVFETRYDETIGLSWHGNDDSVGHETTTTTLAGGLGDLHLTCTRNDGGGGTQELSLDPATTDDQTLKDASVYVEKVTGEGMVEDHVDTYSLEYDPVTGLLGPVDLPRNGMVRVEFKVGDIDRWYIVSSYYVGNNTAKPQLNLCEIAVARF